MFLQKSAKRNQFIDLGKPKKGVATPGATSKKLFFNQKECQTPHRFQDKNQEKSKTGDAVRVYLRVRPVLEEGKEMECISVLNDTTVEAIPPESSMTQRNGEGITNHTFTRVFAPNTSQREVYTITTQPLVRRAFEGFNGLLFAYGITNSGKTYTITGTRDEPGILPRMLADVFNAVGARSSIESDIRKDIFSESYSQRNSFSNNHTISHNSSRNDLLVASERSSHSNNDSLKAELKIDLNSEELEQSLRNAYNNSQQESGSSSNNLHVWLSYVEVYDDRLVDLLVTATSELLANTAVGAGNSLRIMSQEDGSVFIAGVREVQVPTLSEALQLLQLGQRNRCVAETALNSGSSRSHSVLTIKLVHPNTDMYKDPNALHSKICIVDLAGSERQNRTLNCNKRMKEASKINQSLMQLGRCLASLKHNAGLQPDDPEIQVVPFRDSKITHLLQDYLQGYGRTVMLMTASGQSADFDETFHALKYAAIASAVVVAPSSKMLLYQHKQSQRTVVEEKQKELQERKEKIQAKKAKKKANTEAEQAFPVVSNQTAKRKSGELEMMELSEEHAPLISNEDVYIEQLLSEQYELRQKIVVLEQNSVVLESQIRKDVLEEAEKLRLITESNYIRDMDEMKRDLESKFDKKLALREKQFARMMDHNQDLKFDDEMDSVIENLKDQLVKACAKSEELRLENELLEKSLKVSKKSEDKLTQTVEKLNKAYEKLLLDIKESKDHSNKDHEKYESENEMLKNENIFLTQKLLEVEKSSKLEIENSLKEFNQLNLMSQSYQKEIFELTARLSSLESKHEPVSNMTQAFPMEVEISDINIDIDVALQEASDHNPKGKKKTSKKSVPKKLSSKSENLCTHVSSIDFEKYSSKLSLIDPHCDCEVENKIHPATWLCMGCGYLGCGAIDSDVAFRHHESACSSSCVLAFSMIDLTVFCTECKHFVNTDSKRGDIEISRQLRIDSLANASKEDDVVPKNTRKTTRSKNSSSVPLETNRSKRLSVVEAVNSEEAKVDENASSQLAEVAMPRTRHAKIALKQSVRILSPLVQERVKQLQDLASPKKDAKDKEESHSKEDKENLSQSSSDVPIVKRKLGVTKRGKADDEWLDLMESFDPFQKSKTGVSAASEAAKRSAAELLAAGRIRKRGL